MLAVLTSPLFSEVFATPIHPSFFVSINTLVCNLSRQYPADAAVLVLFKVLSRWDLIECHGFIHHLSADDYWSFSLTSLLFFSPVYFHCLWRWLLKPFRIINAQTIKLTTSNQVSVFLISRRPHGLPARPSQKQGLPPPLFLLPHFRHSVATKSLRLHLKIALHWLTLLSVAAAVLVLLPSPPTLLNAITSYLVSPHRLFSARIHFISVSLASTNPLCERIE